MTKKPERTDSRTLCTMIPIIAALALAGCAGTDPKLGGGGTVASGSAGGATTQNASIQLEKCSQTLGTLAVVEDQGAPWYHQLSEYKLGSTVPLLRLMIQQSNCFVIVERGAAMGNMMQERQLESSGELRQGSNFRKGQMVSADYTMRPSITFSQKGTGGAGAALGHLGMFGAIAGTVAGGLRSNEASTTLLMIDNRSGVQLAAAEGSAQNYDFSLFGGIVGGSGAGGIGGYSNTPEGKILAAAFMDSYNNIVRATRNYQAQNVKGGLGTGGTLKVQGEEPAPAAARAAPAAASSPAARKVAIADAQRRLSKLGYDAGPADGAIGGRTVKALKDFQQDRKLPVTGKLDETTTAELMK